MRGQKTAYTDKQKRKAEHIASGYSKQGVGKKAATSRRATANRKGTSARASGRRRAVH